MIKPNVKEYAKKTYMYLYPNSLESINLWEFGEVEENGS